MTITSQLVDARNWRDLKPTLIDKVANATFVGFDLETHDDDAHEGIKDFRGNNTARVFDINRTTVCGFSIYVDGDNTAYYVNLAHADVENRVPWDEARQILDAKPSDAYWVAHNAPFELTMMKKSLGYDLGENIVCTMQMAVSAYGPDEYDPQTFLNAGLGEIRKLFPIVARAFQGYQPGEEMNAEQAELFVKVIGKQSDAAHSYNGFVKEIAYGYGLKKAVASFFGVQMATFKDTLGSAKHMGELTGEQVASYGADDSYWAVRLFHRLLQFMQSTNPAVTKTFFEQENPMVRVFADIWQDGMNVNKEGIAKYRETERAECAKILRELKDHLNHFAFEASPNERLYELEKWYQTGHDNHRRQIAQWLKKPNVDDDFEQCYQVSGAVSTAWAADKGKRKSAGPNFTHYMKIRTVMYDLLGERPMRSAGKVQSDGENRGRVMERIKKRLREKDPDVQFDRNNVPDRDVDKAETHRLGAIRCINQLAGVEQRMKLYLTPYTKLTDPETERMYPTVSSMLATRRMACSNPNSMQLAKRGESTYVRGFFLPDEKDHVLVSIDWSQIELVLIGEFSGDPEFAKAYGQLPYRDLHLGAAADALKVMIPEVTEELMNKLDQMSPEEVNAINPRILIDVDGNSLSPEKAKKYWRTVVGKGSNFNYFYSGALSTVGQTLGWSPDQMWEATDRYRQRFAAAEAWRVRTQQEAVQNGFVILPDGHRRVRFEATQQWAYLMRQRFEQTGDPGIIRFGNEVIRATTSRAKNQIVNAMIQGSCSTLAKRSILRINKEKDLRFRFKMPIHDELLFSVHKDDVWDFITMAKGHMCNHPDIIGNLKMDATASVGLTFEPWDMIKAPLGQIEIDEAPIMECLPKETKGSKLNQDQTKDVIEWLYKTAA